MANETTKIYDAAKEVIEQHYNNGTDIELMAQFIAEDISMAVTAIYGKGSIAKYLLDTISYRVQGWCNPALDDEEDEP